MFNIIKFCKDYRLLITTTGKHFRPGWVNIDCPFCHGRDGHLGVHILSGAVKCWKCGKHSMVSVIMRLLDVDFPVAIDIHENYCANQRPSHNKNVKDSPRERLNKVCALPYGCTALTTRHKQYLAERGFDADYIEKTWGLLGTGPVGPYKFRIIAPIVVDGVMVSYQGRDITEKSDLRYKACRQEDELIEHQTIVYGGDYARGNSCLVVEGITDVWRMGYGSVSCFGTAFTLAQVNFLVSHYRKCFILFDADDVNAINMARELAAMLSARGLDVELIDISDTPKEYLINPKKGIDPANLQQWYANQIMKEVGLL